MYRKLVQRSRTPLTGAASLLALALSAAPQQALAACVNVTATDVECSGNNPNTTVNNTGSGARTVTITTGGTVTSGATTVVAQGSVSGAVTNDGTVQTDSSNGGSSQSAIYVIGPTVTMLNSTTGVVNASGPDAIGVRFLANGTSASLTNLGTISATGTTNSGSFGPQGVFMFLSSADALVQNSGSIRGDGLGLFVQHSGLGETSITNQNNGTISGLTAGILVRDARGPVVISNFGLIERRATNSNGFVPGGIAIFDQNGAATGTQVIINNATGGVIDGGGASGILALQQANGTLEVNNLGTIHGGILQSGGLSALIDNSGTINGSIQLGNGDDLVILRGGSVVMNGALAGGGGNNTLRFVNVGGLTMGPVQLVDNFQTIDLASGSVNFNAADLRLFGSTGTFTIASGATLTVDGATSVVYFDAGGTSTLNGLLDVRRGAEISFNAGTGNSHDFVATSGSTVRFELDSLAGSSVINGLLRGNTIEFQSGSQIHLDVRDLGLLVNGRTLDVAIAGTSLTDSSGAVTDNSILFDFSKQVIGGNTLRLTMVQLLSVADTIDPADPNTDALAGGLQNLIDSGSAGGATVSTVLGSFGTVQDLTAAVQQFAPDSSNMVSLAALNSVEPIFMTVRDRASLSEGAAPGPRLWIAGGLFGRDRDPVRSLRGHHGDGSHFSAGGEFSLSRDGRVILGLGWDHFESRTDEGVGGLNRAELRGDRVFGYLAASPGRFRLNAVFGLGWGKADTVRSIPVLGNSALAAPAFDLSFGRAEIGYRLKLGNVSITPVAGVQFASVTIESHAETGSAGALSFAERKATASRADLGLALSWSRAGPDGGGLQVHTSLRYANTFDRADTPLTTRFVAGGGDFAYLINGLPEDSIEAEVGLRLAIGKSASAGLGYRGSYSAGSTAHAGLATFSIGF